MGRLRGGDLNKLKGHSDFVCHSVVKKSATKCLIR